MQITENARVTRERRARRSGTPGSRLRSVAGRAKLVAPRVVSRPAGAGHSAPSSAFVLNRAGGGGGGGRAWTVQKSAARVVRRPIVFGAAALRQTQSERGRQ